MSTALAYKGWRGTRLQLAVILILMVTAGYLFGDVTAEQWIDFLKWVSTSYGLTEIGVKGASAYKEARSAI